MGAFLGFILFVFLIILFIGLSLISKVVGGIGNLIRLFFGKKNNYYNNNYQTNDSTGKVKVDDTITDTEKKKYKKIIDDDEGEYVDFEEIKD